jgi:hypothetical protein
MSNLRFMKAFVFDSGDKALLTDNTKYSHDLTARQLGIFDKNGLGIGNSPSKAATGYFQIHQNVEDSKFGSIRTKPIHFGQLRAWYGKKYAAPVAQVSYIGYDESDDTKQLKATCGQEYVVPIHLYSEEIKLFWPQGLHKNVLVKTDCCVPCADNCDLVEQTSLAAAIKAAIEADTELAEWFSSITVVTTDVDTTTIAGVKLVGKSPETCVVPCADPHQPFKFDLFSFTIGTQNYCANNWPVTTTITSTPGIGTFCEARSIEVESRGYDIQREAFDNAIYEKNNPAYLTLAGKTYDIYTLQFDYSHRTPGVATPTITEPYEVIFLVVAGTGSTLETKMNLLVAENSLGDVVLGSNDLGVAQTTVN